jgi:hypothetical protein
MNVFLLVRSDNLVISVHATEELAISAALKISSPGFSYSVQRWLVHETPQPTPHSWNEMHFLIEEIDRRLHEETLSRGELTALMDKLNLVKLAAEREAGV